MDPTIAHAAEIILEVMQVEEMRKLRIRQAKYYGQGHTASKCRTKI